MNGLEIADLAASVIARLAPYIVSGLQIGLDIDPVLERQLRGAMELANQALLYSDAKFVAMDKATDERLK